MILEYKKYIFCEEMSSVFTPWLPIYPCVHAIRCPFLYIFHSEKNLNLFATNRCNKMCFCVRLLEWPHWWHTFLSNLWEKQYVIFIISWHCSLGGNFLADALRYLSWPALSRSWHLAASGMGLGVMNHQTGCWPHCTTSTSVFLSKEEIW